MWLIHWSFILMRFYSTFKDRSAGSLAFFRSRLLSVIFFLRALQVRLYIFNVGFAHIRK
jgi:hypothetical protein